MYVFQKQKEVSYQNHLNHETTLYNLPFTKINQKAPGIQFLKCVVKMKLVIVFLVSNLSLTIFKARHKSILFDHQAVGININYDNHTFFFSLFPENMGILVLLIGRCQFQTIHPTFLST